MRAAGGACGAARGTYHSEDAPVGTLFAVIGILVLVVRRGILPRQERRRPFLGRGNPHGRGSRFNATARAVLVSSRLEAEWAGSSSFRRQRSVEHQRQLAAAVQAGGWCGDGGLQAGGAEKWQRAGQTAGIVGSVHRTKNERQEEEAERPRPAAARYSWTEWDGAEGAGLLIGCGGGTGSLAASRQQHWLALLALRPASAPRQGGAYSSKLAPVQPLLLSTALSTLSCRPRQAQGLRA